MRYTIHHTYFYVYVCSCVKRACISLAWRCGRIGIFHTRRISLHYSKRLNLQRKRGCGHLRSKFVNLNKISKYILIQCIHYLYMYIYFFIYFIYLNPYTYNNIHIITNNIHITIYI